MASHADIVGPIDALLLATSKEGIQTLSQTQGIRTFLPLIFLSGGLVIRYLASQNLFQKQSKAFFIFLPTWFNWSSEAIQLLASVL